MSKAKCYAVVKGRMSGIFLEWSQCEESIKGYSGAIYKGFSLQDMKSAEEFLVENGVEPVIVG